MNTRETIKQIRKDIADWQNKLDEAIKRDDRTYAEICRAQISMAKHELNEMFE